MYAPDQLILYMCVCVCASVISFGFTEPPHTVHNNIFTMTTTGTIMLVLFKREPNTTNKHRRTNRHTHTHAPSP